MPLDKTTSGLCQPNALPHQYINWRAVPRADGGVDKVPFDPDRGRNIDPLDPKNWKDEATARSTGHPVGFVFTMDDPYFLIDLDKQRDPVTGAWTDAAKQVAAMFSGAMMEVSQSGTGMHIIGSCDQGAIESAGLRNRWDGTFEFYHKDRFVAFGPYGWHGDPHLDCTAKILSWVPRRPDATQTGLPDTGPVPEYTGPQDDDDLLRAAMSARGSAGTAFGDTASFKALWEADRAVLCRLYPSDTPDEYDHSRADSALVSHLAFWTGKDAARIERLWRRSALAAGQPKMSRADYVRRTIENTAGSVRSVYDKPTAGVSKATVTGDSGDVSSEWRRASDLAGLTVPDREWLVSGLLPSRNVTLLSGAGGTGKSLLALQLAACAAAGQVWLGFDVLKGPAIFFSAEDDMDEMHRRIAGLGIDLCDLTDLHFRSLAGRDALLASLTVGGGIEKTHLYAELEKYCVEQNPVLIVLDTLADLFGGNENDRGQARRFIGMCRHLALSCNCAVVLLSHPSLAGTSSGTGLSGSTAWDGSVRSRLYVERILSGDYESDPDMRRVSVKKSNYGPSGRAFEVRYRAGSFVRVGSTDTVENIHIKAERVFLQLLDRMTSEGRAPGPHKSPNYAPAIFAKQPDAEGIKSSVFQHAMEKLLRNGTITTKNKGPESRNKTILTRPIPPGAKDDEDNNDHF